MTRRTIRTSAAALGCAALLAVAGCGGSSTTTTQTTAAQGTSAQGSSGQSAQQQPRAGGPFAQIDQSALAKDLGVSTAQLQQALAAARPAGPPNGAPPGGGQGSGQPPAGGGGPGGQLAANLAKQLNLPTSKVQQALAKYLPARAQGAAPQAPSTSSSQN
jgi:hypothetical protein